MAAVAKMIAQQESRQGITMKIHNLLTDFCCVCGDGGPCGGDVGMRQSERRKGLAKEERWEEGEGCCWVKGLSTGHPLTWGQAQEDE